MYTYRFVLILSSFRFFSFVVWVLYNRMVGLWVTNSTSPIPRQHFFYIFSSSCTTRTQLEPVNQLPIITSLSLVTTSIIPQNTSQKVSGSVKNIIFNYKLWSVSITSLPSQFWHNVNIYIL